MHCFLCQLRGGCTPHHPGELLPESCNSRVPDESCHTRLCHWPEVFLTAVSAGTFPYVISFATSWPSFSLICDLPDTLYIARLHGIILLRAIVAIAWKTHLEATRVGEAQNPGPNTSLTCAITNPTSIISKASTYRDLADAHGVQLVMASETSATATGQKSFAKQIRKLYPRVLWSQPFPDHHEKSDGTPSLRGKASGVALMTKLRARFTQGTVPQTWQATSRLLHTIVSIGSLHVQFVIVYALPSSHLGSNQFNNDLLVQAAQAMDELPIPAILLGDFNGDPAQWEQGHLFQARGFTDL